jgi:hypothetical protein
LIPVINEPIVCPVLSTIIAPMYHSFPTGQPSVVLTVLFVNVMAVIPGCACALTQATSSDIVAANFLERDIGNPHAV